MSHYHPSQPGQYPTPQYLPPQPKPKRVPTWAKVVTVLVGGPILLAGGCTALFIAGTAGEVAGDDPGPVISTELPTIPTTAPTPEPAPAPTSTSTPTRKPVEKAPSYLPTDGTLLVGKDVKPGTYQTRVVEVDGMAACYWARLDSAGEIIDNNMYVTAGALVTLKVRTTDDAVEINCYGAKWKRVR